MNNFSVSKIGKMDERKITYKFAAGMGVKSEATADPRKEYTLVHPEVDSARMHNLSRVRDASKYANCGNVTWTNEEQIKVHVLLLDPLPNE
jgi:hypothetical protein